MPKLFLSYNTADHVEVEAIASGLRARDVEVFLDRWELVPGRSWPEALEKALGDCSGVAVILGRHGVGRWQQREQYVALNRQTADNLPRYSGVVTGRRATAWVFGA